MTAALTLGRVLVVDDDPEMLRVCERVLGHEGWTVTSTLQSTTAVQSLRDGDFDCVVSDIYMPDLDGFELVHEVRRHDDDLPVVLMTGDPSLAHAVRAIDSGAVSYLVKPFDHGQLASAVARAARRHSVARMRREAASFTRGLALGRTRTVDRTSLDDRLREALDRAWLAFQPILDVRTKRPFAYEALLRTDADKLDHPGVLIAAAERLARIHELGHAVRAAAARAIREIPDGALLFVNVHGLELTDEALFDPAAELSASASRIVLELTERVGIDEAGCASRIAMLRKLGYRIAIDDLGAGYAALGALATFEPEIVKLDMSLVRDIDRHPAKRRVVGAIATLCRELGCRVVAEGIETHHELDAVIDAGVDLVQGFLFARPERRFAVPVW